MTLVTLVSRQLWTQVLTILHLRPSRVILLYSDHPTESAGPMERLRRFIVEQGLTGGATAARIDVISERIPHLNPDEKLFNNLLIAFEGVRERHGLREGDSVNITGGTKLMTAAAFAWAKTRGLSSIYLDRDRELTWLEPRKGGFNTRVERLNPGLVDTFDPVELLKLQAGDEVVQNAGELLELTPESESMDPDTLNRAIRNSERAAESFLRVAGGGLPPTCKSGGDGLEYQSALWALKAGVRRVRRGVKLSIPDRMGFSGEMTDEEIDVLFCRGGRLWLVECKRRRSAVGYADIVRQGSRGPLSDEAKRALGILTEAYEQSQKESMKLDLLLAFRIAGVQGQVVRVMTGRIEDDLRSFAETKGVKMIAAWELPERMRELLASGT